MISGLDLSRTAWRRFRNSYKVNAAKEATLRALYPALWAYRRLRLLSKLRTRSLIWVHFGCGTIADKRFINVDARPFPHVDYLTTSPLMGAIPERSVEMIYACHVFEHISHCGLQARTLLRWRAMLKPGGKLIISVPDFENVVSQFQRGERSFDSMQLALMGGQEYRGNFHFALFTTEHLCELLRNAGFQNIRHWRPEESENWPKDWSWDHSVSLNLMAEKPISA